MDNKENQLKDPIAGGNSDIVMIGIGNEFRRDDGAGRFIAKKIKALNLPGVSVFEAGGEGSELISLWQKKDTVILFDAVSSGAKAGTIFRFEAHSKPLPKQVFQYSTHSFSVAAAIELARALNKLPFNLIVYGIEGKTFEHGAGLSSEVKKAAEEIIKAIERGIRIAHQQNEIVLNR